LVTFFDAEYVEIVLSKETRFDSAQTRPAATAEKRLVCVNYDTLLVNQILSKLILVWKNGGQKIEMSEKLYKKHGVVAIFTEQLLT